MRTSPFFATMALATVGLLASACSPGLAFRGAIASTPSQVLELSWARAKRTRDGIVILGQIREAKCCSNAVKGHIHLVAQGPTGATIAETDTFWGQFIARQLHSASFKAMLPVPQEALVAKIQIEFVTPGRG